MGKVVPVVPLAFPTARRFTSTTAADAIPNADKKRPIAINCRLLNPVTYEWISICNELV